MNRRIARLQIGGFDDGARLRPFGENKQVAFLRSLIAAGLVVIVGRSPSRPERGADGKRRQNKRASCWFPTLHLQVPYELALEWFESGETQIHFADFATTA